METNDQRWSQIIDLLTQVIESTTDARESYLANLAKEITEYAAMDDWIVKASAA